MSDMTIEQLVDALAGNASVTGEVFPSAIRLIEADRHPSGRVWDVAQVVMADQERMRYLAGGNRPAEVAAAVARWADCALTVDQIGSVVAAGGYDPEPFEILAAADWLEKALDDGGEVRSIHGERAGSWISDELALVPGDEIIDRVRRAMDAS